MQIQVFISKNPEKKLLTQPSRLKKFQMFLLNLIKRKKKKLT